MIRTIRPPAVAGAFYPADPGQLTQMIQQYLAAAPPNGPAPKALIAPHAGYVYSGPVAASGYRLVQNVRDKIRRVVLVGPSHRVPFYGLAASSADAFATPLGEVPLDEEAKEILRSLPQIQISDVAHQSEHSLEVHLPFLQMVLDDFTLVPLVAGQATPSEVADVLEALWGGEETLIVISSDLSHYHDYWTARAIDAETTQMIEQRNWQGLTGERACGYVGIRGLLKLAQQHDYHVTTIDVRNSGDTAGDKRQVVGYGTYVLHR